MAIRKAERKKAKLRMGIAAPSGAGKTYSALQLAFGLGGKVGMIDTEHGSGDLYADLGDYDIIQISAPYTVKKYLEAIKEFEESGYSTIIIDSLSHAWAGEGGLLEKQGKLADRPGANSYAAWRSVTPEHNSLVDAMLQSPCHIIATMRSKQDYVLETNDKGKQVPRKVGLAPVQREGMEYEFTVMLDVDMTHTARASKDRTRLFDGVEQTITAETGKSLLAWLESGVAPAPVAKPPGKLLSPPLKTDQYEIEEMRAADIYAAAKCCVERFDTDKDGAYDEVSGVTSNEERLYLWAAIKEFPTLRAYIKEQWKTEREAA